MSYETELCEFGSIGEQVVKSSTAKYNQPDVITLVQNP